MTLGPSIGLIVAVAVVVAIAGAVNGIAGFGFAVVGTMALASTLDPAVAVVFMILPIFAVNVALVTEIAAADLRRCGVRFGPLLIATLVGTVVGMSVLDRLPTAPLRLLLGVVTLVFVATTQQLRPLPRPSFAGDGSRLSGPVGMVAIGGASGLLFGATNVGVQLVAYLRSFDLRHGLFVGVVALVFVGVNGIRIGAAAAFGLYPTVGFLSASVAAAIPAVAGVAVGKRLRRRVTERIRRAIVLWLLTGIGVRLLLGGAGIV